MITHEVEQGSPEWYAARAGKATASNFSKLLSPLGKPSTQWQAYQYKLLAEWLTGRPEDSYKSAWMERGHEVEDEARAWYAFDKNVDVEVVGFIEMDNNLVGCSPDGLLPGGGGLEIKCPTPGVHVEYLLKGVLTNTYIPQVQGSMYVTGRSWWDFVSYVPDIDPLCIRVARDDVYHQKLDIQIQKFCSGMLERRGDLYQRGFQRG